MPGSIACGLLMERIRLQMSVHRVRTTEGRERPRYVMESLAKYMLQEMLKRLASSGQGVAVVSDDPHRAHAEYGREGSADAGHVGQRSKCQINMSRCPKNSTHNTNIRTVQHTVRQCSLFLVRTVL